MLRGALQLAGLVPRPPLGDGRPRSRPADGFTWHVLPGGESLFADGSPLEASADVLKDGSQRTVARVERPDGAVIVKRCRVDGPRAWWREAFRGAKARLEFDHALALRRLGIAAVEPLAWAGRSYWPGESVFVTRCEPDVRSFEEYLGQLPADARRGTAVELGKLLGRMHDAGVAHPDPHPGNFLVAGDPPRFILTDLHAVRFGPPLSWPASLDNLVLLNRWFQLRAARTDRLAFWRAYVSERTTLPAADPDELAKQAERRTHRSNAKFWTNRLGYYQKKNRRFQQLRRSGITGHAVRELPAAFVQQLLADPDAPFRDPAFKVLKNSRSSTVIELPSPTGVAVYKRFRVKSSMVLLKNGLRRSAAMRSWSFGHNLLDRWLPTARPLLVLQRKRLGCPAEGYLLAEKVPNARDLVEAVAAADWQAIRGWSDSLGRLVRQMHEKEVAHRDLKAPNILLSGDSPVLIDLVGVVPGKPVDARTRQQNLARLNASFVRQPAVTRTDRLRFLRAYLCWGLRGSAGWKAWWRAVERGTLAKVAKNERSGRPLA